MRFTAFYVVATMVKAYWVVEHACTTLRYGRSRALFSGHDRDSRYRYLTYLLSFRYNWLTFLPSDT
jgi:hypothetical protein